MPKFLLVLASMASALVPAYVLVLAYDVPWGAALGSVICGGLSFMLSEIADER